MDILRQDTRREHMMTPGSGNKRLLSKRGNKDKTFTITLQNIDPKLSGIGMVWIV
jgi:hypothetical protein